MLPFIAFLLRKSLAEIPGELLDRLVNWAAQNSLRECIERSREAPVITGSAGLTGRGCRFAEMPRDSGKITRRGLHSAVFLDQNPHRVADLLLSMRCCQKKPQTSGSLW